MIKLTVLVAALVLLSSVEAQRRRNTTVASTTTTTEVTTIADVSNAEASTAPSTILKFVDALRQALERRRAERQQRIEERRASALKNLGNLSDRQREYELNRLDRQQTLEEERLQRRREMDARRAGRLPSRELDRVKRLRQLRLLAQAASPDEVSPDENEVDGSLKSPATGDVIRRIVLIEEASGNVRLVDLDSDEGRKLITRVTAAEESAVAKEAAAEDQQAEASKLKLKLGQL